MTQMRLIQNFRGFRAMVVSPVLPEALQSGLLRLELQVEHLQDAVSCDAGKLAACQVLILDGDPGLSPEWIAMLDACAMPPCVIGLVGTEAPSRLRPLMQAGATAFLRKPVHAGAIYSALFLGINAHRRRREAEERLREHEHRRRGRRHVVKAILRMMQRETLDDDAAYEALRRAAMRARIGIEDFCEAWLREAMPDRGSDAPIPIEQERHHG